VDTGNYGNRSPFGALDRLRVFKVFAKRYIVAVGTAGTVGTFVAVGTVGTSITSTTSITFGKTVTIVTFVTAVPVGTSGTVVAAGAVGGLGTIPATLVTHLLIPSRIKIRELLAHAVIDLIFSVGKFTEIFEYFCHFRSFFH
jgi:hypothetical protein